MKPAKLPPLWKSQVQLLADLTGKATIAFRTSDKLVRYTIDGWPMSGQFLGVASPEEKTK